MTNPAFDPSQFPPLVAPRQNAIKLKQTQTADRHLNTIQASIASALEPQFQNGFATFAMTLLGCTGYSPTLPVAQRGPIVQAAFEIGVQGCSVTLWLPTITGTSKSGSAQLFGLPAAIWPVAVNYVLVRTIDAGVTGIAIARVDPSGMITLFKDAAESAFTVNGVMGIQACTATYMWNGSSLMGSKSSYFQRYGTFPY